MLRSSTMQLRYVVLLSPAVCFACYSTPHALDTCFHHSMMLSMVCMFLKNNRKCSLDFSWVISIQYFEAHSMQTRNPFCTNRTATISPTDLTVAIILAYFYSSYTFECLIHKIMLIYSFLEQMTIIVLFWSPFLMV